MGKRFATIWFHYLKTDWFCRYRPELLRLPFVLTAPDHGRMIITAVNPCAYHQGIVVGMVLADARAVVPSLKYFDDIPGLPQKLLTSIAKWCIRFSPIVTIDLPDGIIIDATGMRSSLEWRRILSRFNCRPVNTNRLSCKCSNG
jgi:protein ImuB